MSGRDTRDVSLTNKKTHLLLFLLHLGLQAESSEWEMAREAEAKAGCQSRTTHWDS